MEGKHTVFLQAQRVLLLLHTADFHTSPISCLKNLLMHTVKRSELFEQRSQEVTNLLRLLLALWHWNEDGCRKAKPDGLHSRHIIPMIFMNIIIVTAHEYTTRESVAMRNSRVWETQGLLCYLDKQSWRQLKRRTGEDCRLFNIATHLIPQTP